MNRAIQAITFLSVCLTACVSSNGSDDSDDLDRSQNIAIACTDGWAKCVTTANKKCGPRGFDEVDRSRDSRMTSTGRVDDQSKDRQIYREDIRVDDQGGTLVIRCR